MGRQMETKREVRYALRLPPDLHAALVDMARREDRSLNQQLVYLLRQAVRRDAVRRKRRRGSEQRCPGAVVTAGGWRT